jgi:hypothetical protein
MCEKVLTKSDDYEELTQKYNPLVTTETEAYFIKMQGDFSRYMTDCSDLRKESEIKARLMNLRTAKITQL